MTMAPITNREAVVVHQCLKSMWEGNHFNICAIDKCCKILNLKPDQKTYHLLHALHCVNFSEMSTDLLKETQKMVRELFDIDRIINSEATSTETQVLSDNFRGLLNLDNIV